jgi:hypothetical protein
VSRTLQRGSIVDAQLAEHLLVARDVPSAA